jgi:hypothetical protein
VNNYALNGFGVSGTSGEVSNCNVKSNYYLNTSIVNPGDMFFNDGTVFSPQYDSSGNLIFPSGYNASNVVGVCFWGNTNNDYKLGRFWVVSVDEVQLYWCPNGLTSGSGWNPVDISTLYNFNDSESALKDYEGKNNTNYIVTDPSFVYRSNGESDSLSTSNCAAKYSYEYRRNNGSEAVWFLPSIGQLRELEKELPIVNTVLSKLGRTQLSGWYWSSDEVSKQQAWAYYFPYTSNLPAYQNKKSNQKVRPMAIIYKSK